MSAIVLVYYFYFTTRSSACGDHRLEMVGLQPARSRTLTRTQHPPSLRSADKFQVSDIYVGTRRGVMVTDISDVNWNEMALTLSSLNEQQSVIIVVYCVQ